METHALLLAGLAAVLMSTSEVSADAFRISPIVAEEQRIHAECTWPLEPVYGGATKFTPQIHTMADPLNILLEDDKILLALALFSALGGIVLYVDFHEILEDEKASEAGKASSQASSSSGLPLVLTVFVVMIMGFVGSLHAHSDPCQRHPVLVPSRAALLAWAVGNGQELIQFQVPQEVSALPDCVVACLLSIFVAVGCRAWYLDLQDMQADEPCSSTVPDNSMSEALPKKSIQDSSLLRSLSANWRLVSCIVLLASIILAAVPALSGM